MYYKLSPAENYISTIPVTKWAPHILLSGLPVFHLDCCHPSFSLGFVLGKPVKSKSTSTLLVLTAKSYTVVRESSQHITLTTTNTPKMVAAPHACDLYLLIHTHAHPHAHTHAHKHTCTHTNMHMHTYTYVHTHTHAHTHSHTHMCTLTSSAHTLLPGPYGAQCWGGDDWDGGGQCVSPWAALVHTVVCALPPMH